MIFDWWNGGAWGGVPACRLGHVMADVIMGCHRAVFVKGATASLGVNDDDDPEVPGPQNTPKLHAPEFQNKTGGAITWSPTTTVSAAGYDGMAVGSAVFAHNWDEALALLKSFCVEPSEMAEAGFLGYDFRGYYLMYDEEEEEWLQVTEAYLGIADLEAGDLTRGQQAAKWARLREALKKLRYYRVLREAVDSDWPDKLTEASCAGGAWEKFSTITTEPSDTAATPLAVMQSLADQARAGAEASSGGMGLFGDWGKYFGRLYQLSARTTPPLPTDEWNDTFTYGLYTGVVGAWPLNWRHLGGEEAFYFMPDAEVLYSLATLKRLGPSLAYSAVEFTADWEDVDIDVGGVGVVGNGDFTVEFTAGRETVDLTLEDRDITGYEEAGTNPVTWSTVEGAAWGVSKWEAIYDLDYVPED